MEFQDVFAKFFIWIILQRGAKNNIEVRLFVWERVKFMIMKPLCLVVIWYDSTFLGEKVSNIYTVEKTPADIV